MKVSTKLLLKTAEECSEAAAAIIRFIDKEDTKEAKDLREHFSKELGDVSTFISLLLNLELIDNKIFWAQHDEKTKKWTEKLSLMLTEAKKEDKNNDDSNGREENSSGQSD